MGKLKEGKFDLGAVSGGQKQKSRKPVTGLMDRVDEPVGTIQPNEQ